MTLLILIKFNDKSNHCKNKIEDFNKSITVSGDKSLSIRWVLFSSIAKGKSKAYNLLLSEDVLAAINAVKKLGAKVKLIKIIAQSLVMDQVATNTKKYNN